MVPCAICGTALPEGGGLCGPGGPTCAACLQEAEEAVARREGDLRAILGPPLLVLAAFLATCVPLVGPVVGGICALTAVAAGFAAVRRWREAEEAGPLEPDRHRLLLLSGVLSVVAGLFEAVVAAILLVGQILLLTGNR